MTPTCVNRTTLLVDDSDSQSLTDHYLDETQQFFYSLQLIVVLFSLLLEPLDQLNSENQLPSTVKCSSALQIEQSV